MFAYLSKFVANAEAIAAAGGDSAEIFKRLRQLPFDQFAKLMIDLPDPKYPALSKALPRMAAEEVQRNWTGDHGVSLLRITTTFVRLLSHVYRDVVLAPLDQARILDYGCGYGRIMRCLYYFTDPINLYGCDPWDESIRLCREAGMIGQIAQSEYMPKRLPFEGNFDIIFAFSVFTQLSKRTTIQNMIVLGEALSPRGLLAITIRPVEYWHLHYSQAPLRAEKMIAAHEKEGFAFEPHARAAVDGEVTYGDTSMTLEFLQRTFPNLRIQRIEHSLDDSHQIIVFLKRA